MKKTMFKRCMALLVSTTMLFSSVNLGFATTSVPDKSNSEPVVLRGVSKNITLTDAEIVADNYSEELSDEETAILDSEYVSGNTHSFAVPSESDKLVAVDSDNKVVYAKNYTSGDYEWVAEEAELVVDGEVVETLTLSAEAGTYEEENYDSRAAFTYSGDGYSVSVVYNVYVTVDTADQNDLLSVSNDLATVIDYLEAMSNAQDSLDLIVENVIPELLNYTDSSKNSLGVTFSSEEMKNAIISLNEEYKEYGTAEMNYLVQNKVTDGVDGYAKQSDKLSNAIEYMNIYEASAKQTYEYLNTIATDQSIATIKSFLELMGKTNEAKLFDTAMTYTANTAADLSAAGTNEWPELSECAVKDDLTSDQMISLLSLVKAAIGKTSAHTAGTETDLLAATTEIACNVNRYNVSVSVEIYAVGSSNSVELMASKNTVVNLASSTSKDDVVSAIDATQVEANLVQLVNTYDNGIYNVNTINYVRTVETDLTDKLGADASYKVVYEPAEFTVDYTDEALEDVTVPYGTVIILPVTDVEGKSYEYTIEGVKYDEGEEYSVTKNVTVSRSLQKEKTGLRLLDLVNTYYSDELSDDAANILANLAVNSETVYIRMPGDDLVALEGSKVVAQSYDAGGDMVWEPAVAYVKDGNTVVETIDTFAADGSAEITSSYYTTVEVEYRLEVDIDDDELLAALNIPNTLVTEASSQVADLKQLKGYESKIDQVTKATLNTLGNLMGQDAKDAIAVLIENSCNLETGYLYVSEYIDEYKNLSSDADLLSYYYNNNMYAKFKNQVTLLADNLTVIVMDPALSDPTSDLYQMIRDMGYEEYIARLETISSDLSDLKSRFAVKNELINVNSSAFQTLLTAITGNRDVVEITTENDLYCIETISVDAPLSASVNVIVQIADSEGNVGSTMKLTYSDSFMKETGMSAEALEVYAEKIAEMETSLGLIKSYYECTQNGELPEADAPLSSSVTVTYTWAPKTYTVCIDGEDDITVTYDTRKIKLPGTGDSAYCYYYDICGNTVEVNDTAKDYTLTTEMFDTLFASSDSATISREKVNLAQEKTENIIKAINEALVNKGYENVASLIPFEDVNGNISLVLRINAIDSNVTSAITEIIMQLAKQSYVGLGGNDLVKDGSVYIDTAVQLILNSGIGTESMINMITANGDIVENVKDYVDGQTVVTELATGIPATGELGGLLIESTLSVIEGSEGMSLYISLEDFDDDASELQKLREALVKIEKYITVICEDGAVKIDITAPEKAHELYMALMLVEEEVSLAGFEVPGLVEMVEYAEELLGDSVLYNEDVTAETLLNTAEQVGVDADVAEYVDAINTLISYARKVIDDDPANAEITMANEDGQPDELCRFLATCPSEKLVSALGLSASMASLIVGDVEVPVEITLQNCNTEYKAIVIDLDQSKIYNKFDFTTSADVTAVNNNTVVILLDDVDTVTADDVTYLDLNGHTLGTLNASATVRVFDSRLDTENAGTITTINGTDNVIITAGNYSSDVTEMLPNGYVQNDGAVSNRFYTLSTDEDGNITVEIAADFLELEGGEAYKTMVMELAVDVLLNGYTWASLSVSGNDIYGIEVYDVVDKYKSGLRVLASELVEEVCCEGITAFANDVLAKLTDFAEIAAAIESDSAVAEYTLNTCPWNITLTHETDGDYIAGNVVSGDEKSRTLTIVVAGEDEDKQELADLCTELGEVFGDNIEVTVNLEDLSYSAADGFTYSVSGSVVATADLSNKEYAAVIGIVMANGMEDGDAKTAMIEAVNTYLSTGETADIVTAIESLTTAQIITALKAAIGVEFTEMISDLGVEDTDNKAADLEAIYDDLLQIGYKLVNKLGITGGSGTLAGYSTGDYATYNLTKENWHKVDLDITVILAEEKEIVLPEFVDITMEDNDIVNAMKADYENKLIYVDLPAEGIDHDTFTEYVSFNFENADEISYEFSNTDNGLIQTGEKVTVAASNADGQITVEYTVIVLGDVTGDGMAYSNDAALILRHVVGLSDLSDFANGYGEMAAKINSGDDVDSADAAIVHRKVVELSYRTWLDI